MPVNWLTAADRDRLLRFPHSISETDLISFFTLTKEDRRFVKRHYGASGQLGDDSYFDLLGTRYSNLLLNNPQFLSQDYAGWREV